MINFISNINIKYINIILRILIYNKNKKTVNDCPFLLFYRIILKMEPSTVALSHILFYN